MEDTPVTTKLVPNETTGKNLRKSTITDNASDTSTNNDKIPPLISRMDDDDFRVNYKNFGKGLYLEPKRLLLIKNIPRDDN